MQINNHCFHPRDLPMVMSNEFHNPTHQLIYNHITLPQKPFDALRRQCSRNKPLAFSWTTMLWWKKTRARFLVSDRNRCRHRRRLICIRTFRITARDLNMFITISTHHHYHHHHHQQHIFIICSVMHSILLHRSTDHNRFVCDRFDCVRPTSFAYKSLRGRLCDDRHTQKTFRRRSGVIFGSQQNFLWVTKPKSNLWWFYALAQHNVNIDVYWDSRPLDVIDEDAADRPIIESVIDPFLSVIPEWQNNNSRSRSEPSSSVPNVDNFITAVGQTDFGVI